MQSRTASTTSPTARLVHLGVQRAAVFPTEADEVVDEVVSSREDAADTLAAEAVIWAEATRVGPRVDFRMVLRVVCRTIWVATRATWAGWAIWVE